jgi:hypothetical protein
MVSSFPRINIAAKSKALEILRSVAFAVNAFVKIEQKWQIVIK